MKRLVAWWFARRRYEVTRSGSVFGSAFEVKIDGHRYVTGADGSGWYGRPGDRVAPFPNPSYSLQCRLDRIVSTAKQYGLVWPVPSPLDKLTREEKAFVTRTILGDGR